MGKITLDFTSKPSVAFQTSEIGLYNGAGTGTPGTGATVDGIGTLIGVTASTKATPIDADSIGLSDSADTNDLKKLTWANLKATLKTYFDSLYAIIGSSPALDNTNITGTYATNVNVTGAITIDVLDGKYQMLTRTGDITGITIDNETNAWGIMVKAVNWGAGSVVLGSIKVAGGTLSLTASGEDTLVFYGNGTDIYVKNADADVQ